MGHEDSLIIPFFRFMCAIKPVRSQLRPQA